jgi:predicted PurR-regulated permease PerM
MRTEVMSIQRRVWFWLVTLGLLCFLLWLFSEILLPFIVGMAIAYFLDPVADRLQRLGLNRLFATLLILSLFLVAMALMIFFLAPMLLRQLAAFIERLPLLFAALEGSLNETARDWLGELFPSETPALEGNVAAIVGQAAGWLATLLASLWSGGQVILNLIALFVITPVVAFYLLYDWDRMIGTVDRWIPRDHLGTVRSIARDIDTALAGFVRGQVTVSAILGTFYAVALSALGLNFALVIGIGAGVLNVIPYVGSIIGFIVALGVAAFQYWPEWPWIVAVGGVFVFGQMVEGNFLSPKLVGSSVGLHPVWLMFGLVAFSYLFGFAGTLLAVPAAAAVGVVTRFALRTYMESPLYQGQRARFVEEVPPTAPVPPPPPPLPEPPDAR